MGRRLDVGGSPRTTEVRKVYDQVVFEQRSRKAGKLRTPVVWPTPPIQVTLAQADAFRLRIRQEGVNAAHLAREHGLTRARLSQIVSLHRLCSRVLAFLRRLDPGPISRLFTERRVRPLLRLTETQQLRLARRILPGFV